MQRYRQLAKEIKEIYDTSGDAFHTFQIESGLTCKSGCGKCCLNPDIRATMLEMLPLAIHLIDTDKACEILDKLSSENAHCIFYQWNSPNGENGQCTSYDFRPTVCRIFGASSRISKKGNKELVICKIIKENNSDLINKTDVSKAPVIEFFTNQVMSINASFNANLYPINDALKFVLDKLLLLQSLETSVVL